MCKAFTNTHQIRPNNAPSWPQPDQPGAAWRRWRTAVALAVCAFGGLVQAGTPGVGEPDPNPIPNSALRGDFGALAFANGTISGDVPTLWRAFAIDGAALNLERMELAANVLFPGSPPTAAVKISVTAFGLDQGFDHAIALFPFREGRSYSARVYLRSGNADNSAQSFNFSMPIFDTQLNFTGRDPASFSASASSSWAAFDSPIVTGQVGDGYAHIALRLNDDGGENSIILALPSVDGAAPVDNLAPNPGFVGSAGLIDGMVTGSVPDDWRAFAVGSESLTVATVPLAAGELYPGSPATNAIRLQVSGGDGTTEGFDHELVRATLQGDQMYWGEVYLRSGNASPQGVTLSFPIFDPQGVNTGAPGTTFATVGSDWNLYAGPSFIGTADHTANIGFRLFPDGGEDSILIALPRIVGPAGSLIFADGFE